MKTVSILVLCGSILTVGCKGVSTTEDEPRRLEDTRPVDATFTPGTSHKSAPAWVQELRATIEQVSAEGLASGIAETPPANRIAWLLYDPDLSPPNWIISGAGNLPAKWDALRTHIAYLRVQRGGSFAVGFSREGALIDESTGKKIARPLFLTDEGPNLPVRLNLFGQEEWERTRLPIIGPVRFKVNR